MRQLSAADMGKSAEILTPPAGFGKVQLRLASLACTQQELTRLQGFLSNEELQRGNRLLDQERRRRFFVGRGVVRETLAGFLGEEPQDIRLSEGEFGKLHLSDYLQSDALCFNVSHAGDLLLMAFCAGSEVGVDMEKVRADLSFAPMAKRYFSDRENKELFALPPSEQLSAFYRCWTRKEAYLKGTGSGFSQPSNGFDISLLPGHPPALLAHRGSPTQTGSWVIGDVETPAGYCAALALSTAFPSQLPA